MRTGQPYASPSRTRGARRVAGALAIGAAVAFAGACGGSTAVETIVGPDPVRCQTTLSAPSGMLPPEGGSVNVSVNASRDCTWTASTDASWMQLNATSGQGTATLAVSIARNDQPTPRSGSVLVNDQRVTLSQEPRPCTYELRPASQNISSSGGRGGVSVETLSGCTWTANSSAQWLRVVSGSGSGAGTAEFDVDPNPGGVREATITIGGQRATVVQSAAGPDTPPPPTCVATFTPPSIDAAGAGGTHTLAVAIGPACNWTATSSAPWLAFTTPPSGRGNGTLRLSVARNTGAARSATVAIGLQSAAVNQAAAPVCTYAIDPSSLGFPAGGGEGRVRVTTQEGCEWSTSGGAGWTRVTNGAGMGNGEVRYTVSANSATSSRSTTLTIGGRTHSVSQQAAAPTCTYAIDPGSRAFGAAGGNATVTVTTQAGCGWSASGAPSWAAVSGGQGTGAGQFTYTVQANSGTSARSGSISVAGQTHSISQEAAAPTCTYVLQPASQNFAAGGGEGRFTVVTEAGCAWSASSGAPWASVSTASGTGRGEVVYTVQANGATAARSTGITVNGQTHAVTQDGAAQTCTYAVQPASASFGAAGGDGGFDVVTQAGCTWSAASGAPWTTVGTPGGSGPGRVAYNVQANGATSPRTTTITVNGQAHSVMQEAAAPTCTYAVQPASASFGAAGGSGGFDVVTQAGCAWSAASGAAWTSVGTPGGSGPGRVTYSVQANGATSPRTTTITVNGQAHTVMQEAAAPTCTYTLQPASQTFAAAGGSGSFTVVTQAGCAWTASSGATWTTVSTPGGSGQGDVSYTVQANTASAPRQTTITVNGQAHTVMQDAAPPPPPPPCSYSIAPASRDFGPAGGEGTVTVTTGPTCQWTASSPVPWIVVTSAGGTGSGEVRYTVSPNGGDDREATLSVAGQGHRVRQEEEDDD